jgi:DNA-directed RNA polymerase specialized sigma24 family protein
MEVQANVALRPELQIAQRLESHAHAARIKKLLLYATAGHWETDNQQLQQRPIQPMLEQLHQLYPTAQQLRFYLYTIAANLTKSREYQQLANVVLLECTALYATAGNDNDDEPTAFFASSATPPAPAPETGMLEEQCQIAQILELMPERDRIVKLMLCLMYDTWESDAEKVAQTSIRVLIQSIWQKYASLIEVEHQLVAIVQRLSKAVEYSTLASTIVQQIAPLYGLYQDDDEEQSLPLVQAIDGFDLRLELMKFTNPLRAKILLFSLSDQRFSGSEADWAALKRHGLETLLKKVLATQPAAELGQNLLAMARSLPDAEDYEQVVDVLMRALKLPAIVPPDTQPPADDDDAGEATEIRLSPMIINTF